MIVQLPARAGRCLRAGEGGAVPASAFRPSRIGRPPLDDATRSPATATMAIVLAFASASCGIAHTGEAFPPPDEQALVEIIIAGQILEPLGLDRTRFPTDPAMPEPFARGYYAGEDGKGPFEDYTVTNPAVAWTAGAMISTLDDLRTWAKALATGTLLAPATHADQMRFGQIAAEPLHVGYGLGIGDFGGLIGHNGAIFGYTTAMFYWPPADAISVLAGNQASNFSNAATEIAV